MSCSSRCGLSAESLAKRAALSLPFGEPYSLDELGHPIFLISSMAMHTQNLKAASRASLLVTLPDAQGDLLGASRVTLM